MDSKYDQLNAKREISEFAKTANCKIKQNLIISRYISEIEEFLEINRQLLEKYSISNDLPQKKQKQFKAELLVIIEKLRAKNIKLKKDNQISQSKHDNLMKSLKVKTQQSSELDSANDDNFMLFNALKEKEAMIMRVLKDIENMKKNYDLFELKRENFICNKNSSTKEFNYCLAIQQNDLYNKALYYNRLNNRYSRLEKGKYILRKLINESSHHQRDELDTKGSDHQIVDTWKTNPDPKDNEQIINNDKRPIEEEEGTYEAGDILDDTDLEINSDDDCVFGQKITHERTIGNTYKDKIQSRVPTINLRQIEFNKMKFKQEIDISSLQRRNNNESVDSQIRQMNNKIRLLRKKKLEGDEKIEKYNNCLAQLSSKMNMISKPTIESKLAFINLDNNAIYQQNYKNKYPREVETSINNNNFHKIGNTKLIFSG